MTRSTRLRALILLPAICAAGIAYHHSTEDMMVGAAKAFLASAQPQPAAGRPFQNG